MGSLSSAGMSESAIGSISQALGFLGSGNISALQGSNMQNLLVMGAARSGMSYGDLLHNGLSADAANTLLSGIVSYIAEMGGSASNVVKSEYARIFGLSVSDLVAARNASKVTGDVGRTTIGTDITELLQNVDKFVNPVLKISNALDNLVYEGATNVASSTLNYGLFKSFGLLGSISQAFGAESILTKGLNIAQLATSVVGFGKAIGSAMTNLGGGLPLGSIVMGNEVMMPMEDGSLITIGTLDQFDTTRGTGALNIFNTLGRRGFEGMQTGFAGSMFGFSGESGLSQSGSMYFGSKNGANTSSTTEGDRITADVVQSRTIDDVYNMLTDAVRAITDLPNQPFGTITRIAEAGNTVTIGNDLSYMQDIMTMMAMNVQNIYSLLAAKFSGAETAQTVDVGSMQWNNHFDWVQTAIGGSRA